MSPYHHAISSAKKFGGIPDDYALIHNWFDETKAHTGDWTHRALRHHSWGIEQCIVEFGHCVVTSEGKEIPTKLVAEQHVIEDCGFIPTVKDYLQELHQCPPNWMTKVKTKSRDLEEAK
jgi:hypothetical protein